MIKKKLIKSKEEDNCLQLIQDKTIQKRRNKIQGFKDRIRIPKEEENF